MDICEENPKPTSRIANVRLFIEPPWLPDNTYLFTGLPENFIESADRELELDGELISYIEVQGIPKIERIKSFENSKTQQSFFSSQVKSPLWDVYYGVSPAGVHYSILVEYHVHRGIRFDKEESRRIAYLEYQEFFDKAAMEYAIRNARATTEMVADYAMRSASHKIMTKYGISTKEMGAIIAEGTKKWSTFKRAQNEKPTSRHKQDQSCDPE